MTKKIAGIINMIKLYIIFHTASKLLPQKRQKQLNAVIPIKIGLILKH
jgi:hypothetical protein